jgi:hypothetical protein
MAQISGVVVESGTDLPVPFVSVNYKVAGQSKVVVADKAGNFLVPQKNVTLLNITCLGYIPKQISVAAGTAKIVVELVVDTKWLSEVVITPKNNPAHRIIRRAIKNKDINNHEKYEEYSYRNYVKSIFELVLSSRDSIIDSSKHPSYVTETVALCSKKDGRSEEKIVANKTAGMQSDIMGQAVYSLSYRAISFYNNSLAIFGGSQAQNRMSEYVSPLSAGSISVYNFTLEETHIADNEQDSIFEISFFPRKSTNINGLMGTLWISSDGYALVRVVAEPHDDVKTKFKFKQDYARINGKWFPTDLEAAVEMGKLPVGNIPRKKGKKLVDVGVRPVYSLVSKISEVEYSVQGKIANSLESIFLDEDSIKKNKNLFDKIRPVPLTAREITLSLNADTAFNKMRKIGVDIDYFLDLAPKLAENKFPMKKIDIDFTRILSQNKQEKFRLGLGLHTSEKLTKWVSTGGYFGYGTKDKTWKYGADFELIFDKRHELRLKYLYQNTLKEAGESLAGGERDWNNSFWRNFIATRFDRAVENKVALNYQPFSTLQMNVSFSAKTLTPLYDYLFNASKLDNYAADDIAISLRYAVGEKLSTVGTLHRKVRKRGNPIFMLNYTRGVNWLNSQSAEYQKIEASVDVSFYNGRVGQSKLRVAAGYIDSQLPYTLLFTGEGSKGRELSYLVKNSFQTMQPYEFLSDKYVRVFYTHNLGALLLKTKHFSPEFLLAYNAGWGDLKTPESHTIDFQTQEHVFLEGGLIINKLVQVPIAKFATFNLGLGAFYRHGYYQLPQWQKNTAFKISFSLTF